MIELKNISSSDFKLFILVTEVYKKYLKYAPKSSTNIIYKSISKEIKEDCKMFIKINNRHTHFNIKTHEATVFCSALLYYLGYPDRDRHNDRFLRNIAISLIKQLKNDK